MTTRTKADEVAAAENAMRNAAARYAEAIDRASFVHMQGTETDYQAARAYIATARQVHVKAIDAWFAAKERS